MLWRVEFDRWLAGHSQKLLMLKMMLNKIRIIILRPPILRLFNRLHGDMVQQNISLFGSNLFPSIKHLFGPSSNKGVAVSFKIFASSKCLILCNFNWSISWAHFNWNFDARIMNYWYWRWLKRIKNAQFLILAASLPTSILNYGFLSFSARRTKKPSDKGEVSRPNEVRENPCRAEWKFQNRTNMHCNLQFSVLDILPSITGSWCSRGNKILFGIWELSATD